MFMKTYFVFATLIFTFAQVASADMGVGIGVQLNGAAEGLGIHAVSPELFHADKKDKSTAFRSFFSAEEFRISNVAKDQWGQFESPNVDVFSAGLRLEDLRFQSHVFHIDIGFSYLNISDRLTGTPTTPGGFLAAIGWDFHLSESDALFVNVDLISSEIKADKVPGRPAILTGRTVALGYKRIF